MPLTANALPSTVPSFALPYDSQAAFANAQVITSTGYLNNINSGQIDLGATGSPSSGSISVDGDEITHMSSSKLTQWRARHVGFVFQMYNLIPVLTAYQNVELPLLLT